MTESDQDATVPFVLIMLGCGAYLVGGWVGVGCAMLLVACVIALAFILS